MENVNIAMYIKTMVEYVVYFVYFVYSVYFVYFGMVEYSTFCTFCIAVTEEESDYGEEEVGDGEDQDQTETESEEEVHSPNTCRRSCKTRCRFPVRS